LSRAKIVINDLTKDVRFTLTQKWDRSPDALAVSIAFSIQQILLTLLLCCTVLQRRKLYLFYGWR
jgi:hypothetical protein